MLIAAVKVLLATMDSQSTLRRDVRLYAQLPLNLFDSKRSNAVADDDATTTSSSASSSSSSSSSLLPFDSPAMRRSLSRLAHLRLLKRKALTRLVDEQLRKANAT
jgi:hypothetical protein